MDKLKKSYDPKNTEERIYQLWEESGFFNPDNLPDDRSKTFTIVLPPPNATGVLHLGHVLEDSMQDTVIRYNRMQGKKTLWLPGTDHAAIATDSKVTKILEKEGLKKKDIGREKFLEHLNKFVDGSRKTIVTQLRKIGASLDWSREAFTLDEQRNRAVKTAFKKMYDDGLIYRGHRIVNWDPKGQTVISDDEIVYEERKNKFYTFKYGPFEIGTARPETKFGDKYVVMHPDDKRYKKWKHGDKLSVEWINGPIEATVIKDEMIDMEFGTGVMTITPWHSHEDFQLAEKYNLDKEQIIDKYGKLLSVAGEFTGMKISDAREKIVQKLKDKGLLVSVDENYVNRIATAERTGGIIEPQIMLQWFVDVNKKIKECENKSLKELMLRPVRDKKIKIIPEHFEKVYFGLEKPEGNGWEQDSDVLDTWFSSALWPFSTMGWPENTEDLKNYYPTTILETGYDIIFFWVARMILMSQFLLGKIPFQTVYLHGIVRDEQGRKISKSLGNNMDPVDMGAKYGTDALRLSLLSGTSPGTDSKISVEKIKGYKNFANKIWNITRFVLDNTEKEDFNKKIQDELTEEFREIAKDITTDMENYRLHLASEKIYQYVWHRFADEIIEETKEIIKTGGEKAAERKKVLASIWMDCLKILHPFMPFVTEEIWGILPIEEKNLLMVEKWPVD